MKKLFGSEGKQVPSQSVSGFGALPGFAKTGYQDLFSAAQPILDNPGSYFSPIGITDEETQALDLIQAYQDPDQFQKNIEAYLNPYRNIITQDINQAFEDPNSAFASRASEAGAFGSSRMREGEADLEKERFDAIIRGLSGQYNTALGQNQNTISNLLGFGGLERGVDFAQRQALPNALNSYAGLLNPLLGGSTQTGGYTTGGSSGLLGGIGKVANLASGAAGLFGDLAGAGAGAGLWGGLDPGTGITWNSGRV